MEGIIQKDDGTCGAKVGGGMVFTYEGARKYYQILVKIAYSDTSVEKTIALATAEEDMVKIGFTWEELEEIEKKVLQTM